MQIFLLIVVCLTAPIFVKAEHLELIVRDRKLGVQTVHLINCSANL